MAKMRETLRKQMEEEQQELEAKMEKQRRDRLSSKNIDIPSQSTMTNEEVEQKIAEDFKEPEKDSGQEIGP